MAFPHPQSRKGNYRNGDIPNYGCVVWKFLKRTINITDYRNAKDDVNPAKNRTLGGILHMLILQYLSVENLPHTFFDPRRPSFGLFGCRKIKNVSSLPPRRQCIKSSFQGRDFIQFIL